MAEETRGVFTLKTVRNNILNDEFVTPDEAFSSNITSSPNVGYYAGGIPSPNKSSTEKLNYGTDTTTAVPSANLTVSRYNAGAVSTVNNGYIMGGAPSLSSADKLSYVTETYSGTIPLPYARQYACGTGNNNAGYLGGGDGAATVSIVDKMIFAVDASFSLPSASLSAARTYLTSSSSPSAGYYGGGSPGYNSRMDKLTFSTETTAYIPAGNLSKNIYGMVATGDSSASYWGGGYTGAFQSGVDKLTYSTDTTAALPASSNLSLEKMQRGRLSAATAGYYSGGTPGSITTTDKFTFSSETASATPSAATTTPLYAMTGVSPRSITGYSLPLSGYVASTQNLKGASSPGFGYWAGGSPGPSGTSQIVKHTFSSDSAGRVPSADLNTVRYAGAGMSSGNNFYVSAGGNPALSSTEKVSYASDTATSIPGAAVSQERRTLMGVGNKDKGYAVGGAVTGINYSIVDKITYSTETSVRIPAANLLATPAGVSVAAGAGTPGFGFIAGGFSVSIPGRISSFDRIDYTTETTSRSPSTNLPQANNNLTGTGNGYAGYRAGGETPSSISNISRHVYSTDTVSYLTNSLPSGNQTNFESNGSGVSAYWGGNVSNLDKMSYNTETGYTIPATAVDKGYASAASTEEFDMPHKRPETPTLTSSIPGSVSNNGYIAGGFSVPGTLRSDVDKLIFATDTVQYLPSTTLSAARYRHTGSASSTAGYFGGGSVTPGRRSTMDKLTFSTDSCVAVPGAALSEATYGAATASSTTFGYFAGGAPGGPYRSTTDKLTFSSDTTATVPSAQLNQGLFFGDGGSASSSAAYLGGSIDIPGTPLSSVARITFSNDTRNQVPSAALIASKYSQTAGHNTTHAYFTGGAPSIVSTVSKITFATETTQQSTNYPITIYENSACGNATAGYFSNGSNPSPNYISSIYKLNYTTETFGLMGVSFLSLGNAASASLSAREGGASYTSNTL